MTQLDNQETSITQAIAASEERLRALVTATSDVIYRLSADWTIMYPLDGRGFLKDTQQPITGWQARNVYPDDLEIVRKTIDEAIRTKSIFQLEHRVVTVDDTPGWTFSRAVPILDDRGEILEWFGTASDITDRKRAEEEVRKTREQAYKQERLYEAIVSGTPDLMYVFDLHYRFTYANKALLAMWGKTSEEAIGKRLLENGYETWHAEMHEREIDQVVATKQAVRGEVSFPHATLGRRVYDYIFTPVLNEQGEVEAVAGTTRDVTERKQWEQALAKNSEELRTINEEMAAANEEQAASNEELVSTNEELAILNKQLLEAQKQIEEGKDALRLAINAANFGTWFIHSVTREFITDARLKELFGYYPDEELSIEQALAQISEEYRDFVSHKLENAIYNNGDYDVTYPVIGFHDNRLRWLRAIGNLKADPSGAFSAFTGVVMDITEQYLAAETIERTEESLRMAMDSGDLATWYLNEQTGDFMASTRFNEIFGFGPQDEVKYDAGINQILPEYRQMVLEAVEESFNSGADFNVEYALEGFNDGKQRWVRSVGKFVADEKSGNYITGVMADITEQKMDEIRKNDFIAMVSHELKTPLTSLGAIIQVAEGKLRSSTDQFLAEAMTKANTQVKRMSKLINGFLNISRLESGKISIEKETFNMEALINEVVDEMRISVTTHTMDLSMSCPVQVYADRNKINSVISNLISNAVKYSPKGSTVSIGCEPIGNHVIVHVSDQGIGLNSEDAERIFNRYYRVENSSTHNVSGFGIGLYLTAEIVKRHQGNIWVESEHGKGSTFYFSLPC